MIKLIIMFKFKIKLTKIKKIIILFLFNNLKKKVLKPVAVLAVVRKTWVIIQIIKI